MNYENILLEQPEAGIYLLTLNRPKALNALSPALVGELGDAVERVGADRDARVLLITGAGSKAFAAGADIAAMRDMTGIEGRDFSAKMMRVLRRMETLSVPVIALVNGYALGGGCELAMACDFILASDKAVFGQPEVNLGVSPGFGGSQRLPRLVGRGRALELLFTGRQVQAEEAVRIGLAAQMFAADELMPKALEMARLIAGKGPIAVRMTKQLVQRGLDLDVDNACEMEAEVFGLCFSTQDKAEGMGAFLERRPAKFTNK